MITAGEDGRLSPVHSKFDIDNIFPAKTKTQYNFPINLPTKPRYGQHTYVPKNMKQSQAHQFEKEPSIAANTL